MVWVCFIWFPAWFGIAWFVPGTSILWWFVLVGLCCGCVWGFSWFVLVVGVVNWLRAGRFPADF